jgi:hypothetical protein
VIEAKWSHYWIFGCSIFALGWGAANALKVSLRSAVPRSHHFGVSNLTELSLG